MNKIIFFIITAFFISSCGGTIAPDAGQPKVTTHEKNEKTFHDKMLSTQKGISRSVKKNNVGKGGAYRPASSY